jgi:hypothetical protein
MPVHDWQKVGAGIFHDFHNTWIGDLRTALNTEILPPDYYALSEQVAGDTGPDVLTLQAVQDNGRPASAPRADGVTTVATLPPKVRVTQRFEESAYVRKRKTLVIRHSSDDRIVAMIEILSPGNKASAAELRRFLYKATAALHQDINLLVVDLFPPTKRDPQGIHGAIWAEYGDESYEAPPDKPLTLAAYAGELVKTAYVEPIAAGDALPDMPLFLDWESYVLVPLEATYQQAYRGVPRRWREVLEGERRIS